MPSETAGATEDPIAVAAEHWRRRGWDGGPHFLASLSVLRTEELVRLSNESALRAHRLTRARHEALAVLYFSRRGERPLGKLSERLLVHPASVTSTVDSLERLGYARRVPHPTDRRATLARITPKGRRAIEASSQAISDAREGLAALSDAQARDVCTILKRVRAAAGDILGTARQPIDPILVAAENWRQHGWDAGPHFAAALSVVRVEQLIRHSNDAALQPHGLTHARHEALALLYFSRRGELPLGVLSERLLVHPTSVTSTVDTLERLGFAARVAHPDDRRATLARITPSGRRAIEESCQAITDARGGLAALSDSQARRLYTILRRVRAAAGDLAART